MTPDQKIKKELFERFEKEWYKFTGSDMEAYYKSLPDRIAAVIQAKGGNTKF